MIALPGVAIHSKIYESAASLVYRGIREQDGQAIVVKLLKQDYPSPQELTCYRQEYEITRFLNLPGVVKAYSQQNYQRTSAILLEDFGGESIERWMQQRPERFCPMPLANFFRLAIDITEILGRIHHAEIVHKDINPGNIVFNLDTGVVKIIDFGIATRFSRTNPTFKSLHLLEGTLAYLSPEQTGRMNRMLDYRSDFYSLGATFYELLTGQLPFPATDILELVHCHIAKQPVPPHELNSKIPKPVSDLILKLMAKNAEDRYGSAWGIKADLERCDRQLAEIGQINSFQLGLQDVSEQFQIPQKLYGREGEIEALLAAFDRIAARGNEANSPQFHVEMMLVSGYAGVGKSALVQELYKPITAKHGYFIWGKFDQFRRNIPYSAIADALKKLVQQLLGEPDEQIQQWRSRLLSALGSNGQIIIDVIPEVELIIGKQPPVPSVGATEAQNRFNLTFQNFVRVFCSKEHPLVIFLDDLQWFDSATLKLIELILLDEQTQYLFLIGAYRDNEVHPTHPLVLTLLELRKQGVVLQEIILTPLTLEPLSQLIAETLHQNIDTVRDLAQLVLRKTEGNPFFSCEFLRMLYSENLLTFDAKKLSWQWDIAQIEAQDITDNVVELLLSELKRLPEETRQILRLAACVGAEFNLETLAIACEKSPKIISLDLLAAIHAGLIQPLSELDENLLVQDYKFLHDRVQQAAYALIDESHKQVVHLQIGRNLLEKTSPEQRAERLFEIVDHLNFGTELIIEQFERNEIAKLNLQAGQKALAATAYEAAFKYFNIGLKLLDGESWQREYDLTLVLHSEAAEAAYLSGRFDEMERLVEAVLNRAKTVLDTVKVYDSRIQAWMSWGEPKEALKTGLEVLQLLGISLVEAPSQLDVQAGLEETASRLAGREVEDLIDLPEMTEPVPLAAIYILVGIYSPAFISTPALMVLIICKIVNLSIAHGNAIWSLLGYVGYGMILCGVEQDFELGYRFGKLSLNLAKRSNNKRGNCKALMMVSIHIILWKDHLKETFPGLAEGYQSGIESGEFESAGYCALNVCYNSFFAGHELTELEQQTAIYRKATHQIRREIPATYLAMLQQTIINLRGQSENPSRLVGCIYDEEQALSLAIAVKDGTGLHFFYSNKLILCYLFGEYEQAAKTATLAEPYLSAATSLFSVALFHFYDSLIVLSLWANASSSEKAPWLNRVNANQEKMQKWAEHAPMNFLHKYHLVKAEKARVLGQFLEAEEFYEQAIAGAAEHEFIQEEALAYELAAKHYLARGREKIAQTYMKEAHYCYDRWGAIAKVKDLEKRYPQLLNTNLVRQLNPIVTDETICHPTAAIDLAAVMKAAQALSEIIHLDQLIATLMQVVIENAGAETGALVLLEDDRLTVVAQCSGSRQCDLEKIAVAGCAAIPISVIHTVVRIQETVVFDDAVNKSSFLTDPYIQNQQTRSLLCMPILKQSQLIGILYLENNLSTGVFTSNRLQVLNLLIAQAAISLENARLYQQLENYAETLERKVEERTQALQQEIAERRQTEATLQRSEAKFRNIFENSQVGIFRARLSDGLILDANQCFANLFGFDSPEEVIGILHGVDCYVSPRDRSSAIELLNRDGQLQNFEVQLRRRYGTLFWALYSARPSVADECVEGVIADISDRKQAEAALQASEAELRALLAAIPDPLSIFNAEGQLICTIKGNPSYGDECTGKTLHQLFAKEQADEFLNHIQQVLRTQQVLTVEYSQWIAGREIWFSARIALIQHEQVIWLARDITLQKQAEAASILEERNRMAREIHDTLAQAFTGILAQVGAANQVLTDDLEATGAHLDLIKELARTGLVEARRSVVALRPQLLESGSLQSALHRLVAQHRTAATDTTLYYEIEGAAYSLPAEVESNLLRMGQEALTNAIRHANADEIRVELIYDHDRFCLRVKDNGQGFGVGSIQSSDGFGLLGMSERAERIGAQLTIRSQPGRGTEIVVTVSRE
ncbi:MAG: Serine/threonine-protein kinase PknD [Chroococcidiopsis sp. SAG 2025]|uniref:AAA family ATPase n=1 Tax=Chroococcidiopsis sp. SAG 2025 TaxID=171389 RepID=UPI0029370144|nr:AAA family ATPase [Chroococcidiopsis sp. SAG 2025]MDV2997735.1 Serine/threonine-protein kinase PknD [Chroococcidiopsis sp. SAG 2025]